MSVPINRMKNNKLARGGPKGGGGGGKNGGGGGGKANRGGGGGGGPQHNKGGKGPQGKGGKGGQQNRGQPGGQTADVLRAMLKLVFEKQQATLYSNNVLQLTGFRNCPDLEGVKKSVDFNTIGFCDSLASVIHDVIPDVQFICVDDNQITSLQAFLESLIKYNLHDVVKGLSAANNKIGDLGFLNKLSKFRNLIEVSFTGNPVTNNNAYRGTVAKRLPSLLGIDGTGITRQPLGMPWPQPSVPEGQALQLLQNLETFLHALGTSGVDENVLMYDVNSYFSLSMPQDITFPTQCKNKDAQNALSNLRATMKDRNRNLVQVTGNTANRVGRGRADVGTVLQKCVYPRNVQVHHQVDSAADVQLLQSGEGVKGPMAIVTIHGHMTWRHRAQPDDDRFPMMCFDRTFVLIQNPDWKITNDCLTLRQRHETAVFAPQSEHRIGQLAGKYGVPPEVMQVIVQTSSNDSDAAQAAQEVASVGLEGLNACGAFVNNDPAQAIAVARVAVRTGAPPETAAQALQSAGGDVAAAAAALGASA